MLLFYLFTVFISFVLFTITCKIHDGFVTLHGLLIGLLLSVIPLINVYVVILAFAEIIRCKSKSSFWAKKVF